MPNDHDTPQGGARLRSSVDVIGRLAPPPGLDWGDVIDSGRERGLVLCAFIEAAAKRFGIPLEGVRTLQRIWPEGAIVPDGNQWYWHLDGSGDAGRILCILGSGPTELLLGEFELDEVHERDAHPGLEARLEHRVTRPGGILHLNRHTIHRRPYGDPRPRMMLMAHVRSDGHTYRV